MLNFNLKENIKEIRKFSLIKDKLVFISNQSGNYELWCRQVRDNILEQITFLNGDITDFLVNEQEDIVILTVQFKGIEVNKLFIVYLDSKKIEEVTFNHGLNDPSLLTILDDYIFLNMADKTYKLHIYNQSLHYFSENETVNISHSEDSFLEIEYVDHNLINLLLNKDNQVTTLISAADVTCTYFDDDNIYYSVVENEGSKISLYRSDNCKTKDLVVINKGNIQDFIFDKKLKKIFIHTQYGVKDSIWSYNLEEGCLEQLDFPGTIVQQMSANKNGELFILSAGFNTFFNIYKLENDNWQNLSTNNLEDMEVKNFITPTIINYTSFDGLEIEGIFYKSPTSKGITFVWIHGGPQAHEKATYNPYFNTLTNLGFDIFIPNFRGSSGYGLKFQSLANRDWGGGPKKDILKGLTYLREAGLIENNQFIFAGISYGGYLSLLLSSELPHNTVAAINLFGPADLIPFVKDCPKDWHFFMREWVGNIKEDYDLLASISMTNRVNSIKSPILIAYGKNDQRVPYSSIKKFVRKMIKNSKDIKFLEVEDVGHGFMEYEDTKYFMNEIEKFIRNCSKNNKMVEIKHVSFI